jgi:hypothetical protein
VTHVCDTHHTSVTHTHSLSLSHTHTHTLSLSQTHTPSLPHTHTRTHAHKHKQTQTNTNKHKQTQTNTNKHTHTGILPEFAHGHTEALFHIPPPFYFNSHAKLYGQLDSSGRMHAGVLVKVHVQLMRIRCCRRRRRRRRRNSSPTPPPLHTIT